MANHLKFCGCRMCKYGRRTSMGKALIKQSVRRQRHDAKRALQHGEEPDRIVSVPYTD